MDDRLIYEIEAYQSIFKDSDSTVNWLTEKKKLLEDAGFTVVQFSMHSPTKGQYNGNIQATRGENPSSEPLY